ncbi:MAG: hypothetical protein V4693_19495 [Pseudomonadota bacterium]
MKKIAPVVILLLCFLLVWNVFADPFHTSFDLDGDVVDGPLGALIGLLFAGGGLIIAALVVLVVGAVLAVVFAGVGLLLTLGLGVGALVLAAALSPLLLPILIPAAIIWFFMDRSRRNRLKTPAL